ncbi:multidrug transporter [Betaproteobacteria bacterium GR16-43]|nr:multidrug transporter [Betaproteobacteria bacterium GR16-43]
MDALLLAIYAFFVWFIFIKKKWLPWNTTSQVIVVIIPVVALTILILLLNVFAPSSSDVRVLKYVVNIVPQVKGKVIEVPVEPNRLVKKGQVLFKIDPTPYQLAVKSLEAQLASAQGTSRELDEQLVGATGKVNEAQGAVVQAAARTTEVSAKTELARMRVGQNRELVATGAGSKFDLEQAEANLKELEGTLANARAVETQARAAEVQARAGERQIRQRIGAVSGGEYAQVAQVRAQLENARWELEQTTVLAPADGYAINVQLRPGTMTAAFPITPALTFVEEEFQVVALYSQNELHQVAPGNDAEISLITNPGDVIKAKVDSIIWAQGQGQSQMSTALPTTGAQAPPPNKFPVKLIIDPKHKDLFLAAGARGDVAIYTDHMHAIHILRMVLIRITAKTNYLVLKLH